MLPQYEDDPDFLSNYAKPLLVVGDRDEAIRTFERFVVLSSDNIGEGQTDYKELSVVEPDTAITMHLVELLLESENFDQANLLVTEDMHSELENDIKGRELMLKVYLGNGDRESVEKLLDSEGDFLKDDDILASYVSLATSIGYMNAQMRFYLYNDALFALAGRVEERRDLLQAGVKLLLDLGQQNMAERVLIHCWSECRSL